MTSRRRYRSAWIIVLLIAALLILIGSFNLLPRAKAPVDFVIAGAVLGSVGVVNLIRSRRAASDWSGQANDPSQP